MQDGRVLVAFPRWSSVDCSDVSAHPQLFTLGIIQDFTFSDALDSASAIANATVAAWPSYEQNDLGGAVSEVLHSVIGLEVDGDGNVWVLDQGRVGGCAAEEGSVAIRVFGPDGAPVMSYTFDKGSDSVDWAHLFLNDIALDTSRRVLYVTDSGIPDASAGDTAIRGSLYMASYDGGAIHDMTRLLHDNEFVNEDTEFIFCDAEGALDMHTGADGIALRGDGEILYWCPLSSRALYSIETFYLRNSRPGDGAAVYGSKSITHYIAATDAASARPSAADGLTFDNASNLYLSGIEANAVYLEKEGSYVKIAEDDAMKWPDTFTFFDGWLIFSTNCLFANADGVAVEPDFRLWGVYVGNGAYLALDATAAETMSSGLFFTILYAAAVVGLAVGLLALLARRKLCVSKGD
eukprot:gnl/Chilomastix_cuspidata/2577.p1 GENE.gnl/Chilomastix_cuspidata/2577~~gnl/Chilomastix_cuspidata/2577.p1  ORF type:complete len:471 (+),score=196.84 gnl/Chilomastix_cuspidata/2577:194-1414(+)